MIVPIALGIGLHAVMTQPRVVRHELRVGTTGSSTEPCSETTLSAEEIYDRLRAGGGSDAVTSARAEVQRLAEKYVTRLAEIRRVAARMGDSWQGEAAAVAERYSRPAADALESSGARLDECARDHGPLDRQYYAYDKVLKTVVPLPAKPESDALNTLYPFETDTDRAIRKYNDDAARNIAAYADYYVASGDNGRAMPLQFPAPPTGAAPSVVVVPAHGGVGHRPAYVPVPAVAADGAAPYTVSASTGTTVPGGPTWATPGYDAPAYDPPAYDPPGGTTAQSWPADAARPATAGPAPASATPPPGPGGGGAAPGGLFSRPGDEAATGRPGGPGGAGRPGGAAGSGPRAQAGAEFRGRGGVVGTTGAERGGTLGGGAPGARRGRDAEEDEEHRTKYLESEDLGKMWGATEHVAPPVIGERR